MKILLATDGSTFSEAAAQALALQFRPQETEVLVLEVIEPLVYSTPPEMAAGWVPEMAERRKELAKLAEVSLGKAVAILRGAGFKAETRIVDEEVRTGIVGTAEEWKADLIVLGSHGKRGVEKFLLGSVAESVARHAKCSVMIVRTPQIKKPAIKVA
jgi:nucleotide-binding universal stress UspA family protein